MRWESLGLRGINWRSRHAEYWIYLGDRLARGKGLAEEASRLLLRFAFGTLGLHRVFLQVNVTNQSAISLYRRLGFVEEGTAACGGICGRPLRRPSPAFHAVARISTVPE